MVSIRLPPLRERLEDVPLLARHFLDQVSQELGKGVHEISHAALRRLVAHDWPGNVRELRNAIERALVTCRGPRLEADDLSFLDRDLTTPGAWAPPPTLTMQQIEKRAIEATLTRTGGNVKEAAQILGIDRSTMYDKLKRYGISR